MSMLIKLDLEDVGSWVLLGSRWGRCPNASGCAPVRPPPAMTAWLRFGGISWVSSTWLIILPSYSNLLYQYLPTPLGQFKLTNLLSLKLRGNHSRNSRKPTMTDTHRSKTLAII